MPSELIGGGLVTFTCSTITNKIIVELRDSKSHAFCSLITLSKLSKLFMITKKQVFGVKNRSSFWEVAGAHLIGLVS